MIGVYLLTPFVIWFKQQVTNEIFIKVSILFLIISGICRNVTLGGVREILDWDVGQSFEYLAYYMVGYSLRISVKKKSSLKGLIWIAGGIAILCASAYIVYGQMIGKFENVSVTNPWAPTVMIASYAIFKGVSLMETDLNVSDKIKSIILKVSSMTYSIYLIHGLVWELIQKILKVLKCDLTEVYTLIGIPVFTLFVFLISWFWSDIISCLKIKR
jgi:peptidoglycan/LPS O-acetylase OafA/YrhL